MQLPYTLEIQRIEDAMRAWIETALEDGQPIAEPRQHTEYSGKFVLRVSRTLHRQLVEAAEAEGVSLNQLCSTLLAQAVGSTKPSVIHAMFRSGTATCPAPAVSVREEHVDYDTGTDDTRS